MITVLSTVTFTCANEDCFEKDVVVLEIPVDASLKDVYDIYKRKYDYMSRWVFNSKTNNVYCRFCYKEFDMER